MSRGPRAHCDHPAQWARPCVAAPAATGGAPAADAVTPGTTCGATLAAPSEVS